MKAQLTVVNPANGQEVTTLQADTAESVAAKFAVARDAQKAWRQVPFAKRRQILVTFKEGLEKDRERLAALLTAEMGKPIKQARGELVALNARLDFFLEQTQRVLEPRVVHEASGMCERINFEPLGVVANISAWNFPYFVGSNVFVPALITGNAVLYKPSEITAQTGLAIAEHLTSAGLPDGVFQTLVGAGEVGAALLEQPINGVFFTGSYGTGVKIAQAVAHKLIKLQLELGGKDPVYVCDDVDVENAAAGLADGAFYNAGQSCCSVERIYVHRKIYEPFVEAFLATVRGFKVGDPTEEDTYLGPLARQAQLEVLEAQVEDARCKGATVLVGGHRLDGAGYYFAPTVLTDVDHTMAVMRDESFGPIIGLQKVDSDEEAVFLMNNTEYGLTAGVFSKDQQRAESLLAQVNAGTAYWNCCDRVSPCLPWTGRGHSGVGSTLSTLGIETFLQPKAYHLRQP